MQFAVFIVFHSAFENTTFHTNVMLTVMYKSWGIHKFYEREFATLLKFQINANEIRFIFSEVLYLHKNFKI